MRRISALEWVTIDGIFDADTMNEWFLPYHSDERANYITKCIMDCDLYLLGRTTYQMLAPYWSSLKNNEMGVADKLNSIAKYVVSSSLTETTWNNTTIISKNAMEEIKKLKELHGKEILIAGSAKLVRSLMQAGLLDELKLLVHPHIMGKGKRFFMDEMHSELQLVKNKMLDKGVVLLEYRVKSSMN
jgi:dihydrofolate reductase